MKHHTPPRIGEAVEQAKVLAEEKYGSGDLSASPCSPCCGVPVIEGETYTEDCCSKCGLYLADTENGKDHR